MILARDRGDDGFGWLWGVIGNNGLAGGGPIGEGKGGREKGRVRERREERKEDERREKI